MSSQAQSQKVVQLGQDIDRFISRLSEYTIGAGFVENLEDLRDCLGNQASEWYYMDLYNVLNPVILLEQLRSSYQRKNHILGPLEVLRNVLALMPILLTWFALSKASVAFQQATTNNLIAEGASFLVEWEKGFGGILPDSLYFSRVAFLDALLILLLALATFLFHYINNIRSEQSERNAVQLASDFDSLLRDVSKILIQRSDADVLSRTLLQNMQNFIDVIAQKSDDFQDLLTAEQERLQKLNEDRIQAIGDFDQISNTLLDGTSQLSNFADGVSKTLKDFQVVVTDLTSEIHYIPQVQVSLDHTLMSLDGHLGAFELVVQNLTKTIDAKLTDVGYATQTGLSKLAKVSNDLGNSAKDVSENQEALVQLLSAEKNTDDTLIQQVRETAVNLNSIGEKLEELSNGFGNLSQQITGTTTAASQEFKVVNENLKQVATVLLSTEKHYQLSASKLDEISNKMGDAYSELNGTSSEFNAALASYQSAALSFQDAMQQIVHNLNGNKSFQGVSQGSAANNPEIVELVKELRVLNGNLQKRGPLAKLFGG